MEQEPVDAERITIPRWTIKRDPRALGCTICGSAIVKITAEWQQSFVLYLPVDRVSCAAARAPKALPAPSRRQTYGKNPNLAECLTIFDPCQACLRAGSGHGAGDHF